jgi:RNA-directed DNA polymerase
MSREVHVRICEGAEGKFLCATLLIVGVIGTLSETQEILEKVTTFLNDELKLQLSPDKTGITRGKEGTKFLNYLISTHSYKIISKGRYTKRTVSERISLRVPDRKAQEFCQKYGYGDWQTNKPTHRPELMNASDEEIITTYNAELRGLANYYSLAKDVKSKLHKLEYLSNYSLFKTLAAKHKTKMAEILTKLRQGNEFVHRDTVKGKIHELEVFQLKRMGKQKKNWNIDEVPRTLYLTASRTELIRRIEKGECEYCKRNDVPTEVHHVRKLKDLKNKPNLTMWQKVMIARNRKTIILCVECHDLLHAGKLPDDRYSR